MKLLRFIFLLAFVFSMGLFSCDTSKRGDQGEYDWGEQETEETIENDTTENEEEEY